MNLCLQLSGGRKIALPSGPRLTAVDLPGLHSVPPGGPVAAVTSHPTDPNIQGLQNLSQKSWRVHLANGDSVEVKPGKNVRLAPGTRINFGSIEGEIRPTSKASGSRKVWLGAGIGAAALLCVVTLGSWYFEHRLAVNKGRQEGIEHEQACVRENAQKRERELAAQTQKDLAAKQAQEETAHAQKLAAEEQRQKDEVAAARKAEEEAAAKKAEEDAAQKKERDYQDKIEFLAGTWNCHTSFRAPDRTPLQYDKKAIITVSDKMVMISLAKNPDKPFVKGSIKGEDYTSIKWVAADDSNDTNYRGVVMAPARDLPIQIVIDKVGSRIYWQQPQLVIGLKDMTWTMQFGKKEFTLTR